MKPCCTTRVRFLQVSLDPEECAQQNKTRVDRHVEAHYARRQRALEIGAHQHVVSRSAANGAVGNIGDRLGVTIEDLRSPVAQALGIGHVQDDRLLLEI